MTLAAMTAPLSVRAEIRALCKQLLASNQVVAGILILAIICKRSGYPTLRSVTVG